MPENIDIIIDNLNGIVEAIGLIENRFTNISVADDFMLTSDGVLILDAICMRLQTKTKNILFIL